jgi:hypothetical protein
VRDVRYVICFHRIFMHVPKILCEVLDTQASERSSLRPFAGEVMQDAGYELPTCLTLARSSVVCSRCKLLGRRYYRDRS